LVRYTFELSSQDGVFHKNETADFKNITIKQDGKIGDKYVVRFECGAENLHNFTQFFEFVHNCPMLPSSIHLKVTGDVKAATAVKSSFIQTKIKKVYNELEAKKQPSKTKTDPNIVSSINQTSSKDSINATISANVVDYSKLKVGDKFDVLNKTLDFSFVNSQNSQIIKGQVYRRIDLQTLKPIQDAEVTIRNLDFGQCASYRLKTGINGNFVSPKLFIFNEGLTSRFQVIVTANDLTQYKKTVVSGGIGAPAEIDLGNIELWSPLMLENASISASVFDSVNNKALEGVKVSAYQGFVNIDNEQAVKKRENNNVKNAGFIQVGGEKKVIDDFALLQTKEAQLKNHKVYLQNNTNAEGFYEVKELSPNLYTFVFEKEGYYREILSK